MGRTIGRTFSGRRGDYATPCDICGFLWLRSKLRTDGAMRLVCPDEGPGLDAVTLSKLNAQAAQERGFMPHKDRGGPETDAAEWRSYVTFDSYFTPLLDADGSELLDDNGDAFVQLVQE